MKKLMSLFAAILFAGSVFSSTSCNIPDGWSYYTEVTTKNEGNHTGAQKCTVIRANTCGEYEYKICFNSTWYTVTRDGSSCYFYCGGQKYTFSM